MFMDHAMKECEVANFHGQVSDAYAYAWMVMIIRDVTRIKITFK